MAWTYNYYVDNGDVLANMALGAMGIRHTVAVDPTTVRIECEQPKADLLVLVPADPARAHLGVDVPPEKAGSSFRNKPPLVGSGPFLIQEWKSGSYLKLTRNPEYWGEEPAVDEIVFVVYQNAETMVTDLQTGSIDAAQGILPAQFPAVKDLPGITAIDYNYRNWDYLNFNCYDSPDSMGNPVLLDPKFRQALNCAIDREKLAAVAFNGFAAAGTTIMPPDNWTDPDFHWQPPADQLYSFDLAKAGRAAGRGRLRQGRRRPAAPSSGEPITLRFWALTDNVQEQTAGKMMTGLVPGARARDRLRGHRHRRPDLSRLQLRRPDLQARLRHVHLVLGRVLRPGHHAEHVHHGGHRRQQRARLVQRGVRRAERRAVAHPRPRAAQGRTSGGCRRSCTRRRRRSRTCTRGTCRRTTRASGPDGRG